MASKHTTGLVSLEISDIAVDGDVGTTFVVVGETVKGSASLTSTDPTITDFDIEESDSPVESITTAQSTIELAWSTYNINSDTLIELYGGTVAVGPPAVWSAPDSLPDIEKSVRITDKKGNVVVFPRVKLTSKLGMSFSKDKVGQLDVKGKVLQPTKAGVKRMNVTYYV